MGVEGWQLLEQIVKWGAALILVLILIGAALAVVKGTIDAFTKDNQREGE